MRATLTGKTLKLRPLAMADAPVISRYTSDPAVARMTSALPQPNPVVAVEGWLLINQARKPLKRDFIYGMEAEGELVGVIGAHKRENGAVELGYWVGRPFWGRSHASDAVRALAQEAKALGPLEARHYVDNPASGRVLKKAGFVYTGAIEKRFALARGASAPTRVMRYEAQLMAA